MLESPTCRIPPINETAGENYSRPISVTEVERYLDLFHVFCSPFTIILNAVVLYVAAKYIDLGLRLSQYYVVSMTVGDLCFGLFYMSTKRIMACFPEWACFSYYVMVWGTQFVSIGNLLLLNIDKFISLHHPLKYQQIVTKRKVLAATISSWIISFAYPIAVFSKFSRFSVIDKLRDGVKVEIAVSCIAGVHPVVHIVSVLSFYVIPIILSCGISVYIFWIAQFMSRELPGMAESVIERKQRKKMLIKRVLFVFSSTVWTALTFLPYRIVYAAVGLCLLSCQGSPCELHCKHPSIRLIGYIVWFLLPLGCVGNPIITVVTQRIYRVQVKRICGKILHKLKIPKSMCPCLLKSIDDGTITTKEEYVKDAAAVALISTKSPDHGRPSERMSDC